MLIIGGKKYLAAYAAVMSPTGSQPQAITPALQAVIRVLRAKDVQMPERVIDDGLVSEHGLTAHHRQVRTACRELRLLVEDELDADNDVNRLGRPHQRVSTVPGAQVD